MRLFKCQVCGQLLYFENTICERCGHRLGYIAEDFALRALEAADDGWQIAQSGAGGGGSSTTWQLCANSETVDCNWMVAQGTGTPFCTACRHNRTIPDLDVPENLPPWRVLEVAKRRLFYTLMRFQLPLATRTDDPVHGLAFDFLAETPDKPHVLTGHDNGLITIALKEGDDAARERMRTQMGELYRTPLGHFRHEVGHHYWDLLVRDGGCLEDFRAVFGDERADYAEALQAHYARTDDGNWRQNYVSLYASSHPWEDFAETWAHYLHIVDTLEIAGAFGIAIDPKLAHDANLQSDADIDAFGDVEMATILESWLPLTYAVNSLNRSMGHADLYPFVLTGAVVEKLGFIHRLIRQPAEAMRAAA